MYSYLLFSRQSMANMTGVVVILGSLFGRCSAQQPILRSTTDYPADAVSLGYGWNSTYGQKTLGLCVVFTERADLGQDTSATVSNVSDKSSLMTSFDISAEAQVKAVVASGSAKTSFSTSTQLDSNQTNFAVHALTKNGAKYAGPGPTGTLDLAPAFATMAHTNPLLFYKTCGDSFVSALYGGAELDAVVTLQGMTTTDEQTFKTSVQGSYASFSGSGSVATTMKAASDHSALTIHYWQSGGLGGALATNMAGISSLVNGLPAAAASAPVTFQIELTRYESLPSWSGIPRSVSAVAQDRIARRYGQFESLRDEVEAVLAQPQLYILDRGVTIAKLKTLDDQLLGHIQHLSADAKTCVDSLGQQCPIDPSDDVSDYSFRIQMPLMKGAFLDEILLEIDADTLSHLNAELRPTPATTPAFLRVVRSQIAIVQGQQTFLEAHYSADLTQAIGIKWITSVVRERCKQDPNSPDCITNAQTDSWIAQIPQN